VELPEEIIFPPVMLPDADTPVVPSTVVGIVFYPLLTVFSIFSWYFIALAFLHNEQFTLNLEKWLQKRYHVPSKILKSDRHLNIHSDNFGKKTLSLVITDFKKNIDGNTALIISASKNNLDISKLLIECGADVNLKYKNGTIALTWSVKNNNLKLSELLVNYGSNIELKDNNNESIISWALEHGSLEIIKILCKCDDSSENIQKIKESQIETKDSCPICMEKIINHSANLTCKCTHQFCYNCIFESTEQNYKCPVCRSPYIPI
jgi:hypothetical protein